MTTTSPDYQAFATGILEMTAQHFVAMHNNEYDHKSYCQLVWSLYLTACDHCPDEIEALLVKLTAPADCIEKN